MALAGCATQPRQTADATDPTTNTHLLRDNYLARTQSDPLGAWLDNSESLDVDVNYPSSEDTGSSSPASKTMVSTAMRFLGVKYRFGGDTPKEGFDCSGLVAYAAEKSLGLKLPRSAREQAHTGISVDRDELRRGDLVFFNTLGRRNSHVGIYLGDHKFVHAPRTGASIRVDDMDMAYWRARYNGARRLKAPGEPTTRLAEAAETETRDEPSESAHTLKQHRARTASRSTRESRHTTHVSRSGHSTRKSTHSAKSAHASRSPVHTAKQAHATKRATHAPKQTTRTARR